MLGVGVASPGRRGRSRLRRIPRRAAHPPPCRRPHGRRRSVRRSLLRAGALAAFGAIGVGGLAACGDNVASTAASATTPASQLSTKAAIRAVGHRTPRSAVQTAAGGPVLPTWEPTGKQAEQPETTHPADPTHPANRVIPVQPSTPVSSTGRQGTPAPTDQNPPSSLPGFTPRTSRSSAATASRLAGALTRACPVVRARGWLSGSPACAASAAVRRTSWPRGSTRAAWTTRAPLGRVM